MKNSTGNTEIQYLRFQIAALEQLLEVYEKTALEQADKLYGEISERQKAGKAIKASEQFLQTLLDSIPAPVFYKDTDGKYTGCNRAFEDFLGMNKEEIIGKTVFDVAPEEIAACYYEADKVLFQSKGSQVYEAHVRLRNGSARDVIFHKAVFYDLKGTLVGLIGIILDITDRKRVEDSLRKSEASLANAQRIARIGNWEWDIGKNRLWWSDETYRIFGLIRQTFAATYEAFLDSVHPDDREFVKKAVNESLDEKKPHNIDFRIILPDGSIRFIHGQGEVSFDDTGKVIRMNGTVQDVTEQKKAEEELQEFSNFNQTLVGSLPFGMDIVDEEGNILYVSKRFETLLGKKIIGEKCWNTYRDNKKQCDNCFLKEGVRTGKTETVESEGILGGKVFQITHVGLVYKGKKAILEIFNDITGLKQAEKELRLRHKELLRYYEELEIQKGKVEEKNNELEKAKKLADEASHAKGEFLANMSPRYARQ